MIRKKNITNLLLVSLDEKFCKSISKELSTRLDMYNCDCKELIVYDLIDPKDVLDKCGIEYFKKRENSVLNNCANFENTIITIDFQLFKEYFNLFNNSLIIFIFVKNKLNFKVINKIDFDYRNNFLKEKSDIIIPVDKKNINLICDNIIENLKETV